MTRKVSGNISKVKRLRLCKLPDLLRLVTGPFLQSQLRVPQQVPQQVPPATPPPCQGTPARQLYVEMSCGQLSITFLLCVGVLQTLVYKSCYTT